MLIDLFIQVAVGLLIGVLALIPPYTLSLSGMGQSLGAFTSGLNAVFPVVTLGACLATVVGLRVFLFVFTGIAWVWSKIPFTFK